MIVRSPRPESNWTVIQNSVIRHQALTFKARGLLCYLLSLPDNWQISAERIAQSGPDGRDSIRAALNELIGAGYVHRMRSQNGRGQWVTRHVVFDIPCGQPVEKTGDSDVDN